MLVLNSEFVDMFLKSVNVVTLTLSEKLGGFAVFGHPVRRKDNEMSTKIGW